MEDKLRIYIDNLFEKTTPSKKSVELKEEMIQNLHDKYNDLISEGKTDEAAYNIVIAGIGDISDLLKELDEEAKPNVIDTGTYRIKMEQYRRKSAMLTSIAVMMYILCVLPLIMLSGSGFIYASQVGVPVMFLMIAGATGLLIYNSMTKPKKYKKSDTLVEEFREWQSYEKERKQMRKAMSSALWALIVAVYLIVSFITGAWYITWIIFIIAGVIESLINVFFTFRKGK